MNDIRIWLDQEPGTVPGDSEAVEELAAGLSGKGLSVAVGAGWIPITRGLTPPEQILIYIGSGVSAALLNAIVTDVYNAAKDWGRKRFGNKSRLVDARAQEFVIFGPDGERLISWWIDGKGENEFDYRREFDVILKAAGRNKIPVMKELRALFDVDITQVKYIVENTPFRLLKRADKKTADQVKATLEGAGATVTVRRHQTERDGSQKRAQA